MCVKKKKKKKKNTERRSGKNEQFHKDHIAYISVSVDLMYKSTPYLMNTPISSNFMKFIFKLNFAPNT